mmetsp:Transcript_25960/g.33769  ORF Transcript_25960/g.33769 Transcript_25960/m.33769 type:complete len:169 (-) Transcript_25960:146-652(-)
MTSSTFFLFFILIRYWIPTTSMTYSVNGIQQNPAQVNMIRPPPLVIGGPDMAQSLVEVSYQTDISHNLKSYTTFEILNDLSLISTINISSLLSFIINGNSFTFDGRNTIQLFSIVNSTVQLNNLTITNGYSKYGGGLNADQCTLELNYCIIQNNTGLSNRSYTVVGHI